MEVKEFMAHIKSIKLVTHRLGHEMTDYPENSFDVIKTIFNNHEMLDACSGFEFEIRFTKDLIFVVIHDKFIVDIADTKVFISKLY